MVLLATGGCMMAIAGPAADERDPALQACVAQDNDAVRLKCYDAAMRRSAKSSAPDQPSAPAKRASSEQDFGLSPSQLAAHEHVPQPAREMTALVSAVARPRQGRLQLTLANGQVWLQTDSADAYFLVRAGDTVTVTPGALGGFMMTSSGSGNRTIRVRRVQ